MKLPLLLVVLIFGLRLSAQHNYSGTATDEQGKPLSGVIVSYDKMGRTATDSLGRFSFSDSSENLLITFTHVGFDPLSFKPVAKNMEVRLLQNNTTLAETIVHSFETFGKIKSIPASVGLITKTDINRFANQNLVSAVNTIAGVKMDERSPGSYRLNIRGNALRSPFGVRNVKVYLNGIPYTDANGTTYMNQLSVEQVDKIEILKGPSGSMYGAGTSGVVLLSNDFNSDKKRELDINLSAGSYNMIATGITFKHSTGVANQSVSFSHQQSDGYRQHSKMRRDVVNYHMQLRAGKKDKLSANIFYSDLFYQTPGGLNATELTNNPRQARPAAGSFSGAVNQNAYLQLRTLFTGLSHEHLFSQKLKNITALYVSHTDFKNPTIRNFELRKENGIGVRSVATFQTNKFTGAFGGEFQLSGADASTYANLNGNPDTIQFEDDLRTTQFNVFIQGGVNLGNQTNLSAGISLNNNTMSSTRTGQKLSATIDPAWAPRISVSKKAINLLFYISAGKGFSPPSIDELRGGNNFFNKELKAETSFNAEAGIKGNFLKNKLWVEGSLYQFRLRNTIVSRRDSAGGDLFINAGKTRQTGLEATLNFLAINNTNSIIRKLRFWFNYTYIHAEFTNYQQGILKFDGNKVTGTVPNIVNAGADIESSFNVFANITYNYNDLVPLNDGNTVNGRNYHLIFMKIGYRFIINKKISTEIFYSHENAFNNPFSLGNDLNAAGGRYFNPSAPINNYAGLKVKIIL